MSDAIQAEPTENQRLSHDLAALKSSLETHQKQLTEITQSNLQIKQLIRQLSTSGFTSSNREITPHSEAGTRHPKCKPSINKPTAIDRITLGRVEWLLIAQINDIFKARIDTGATTSSLSADRITTFERDGKPWVKFFLTHDGTDNIPLEAPLLRYAKIRQASAETAEQRPVITLNIRIGTITDVAEFTLTDRSSMNYPVLLGREFLKDIALVDVAKKYIQGKPELISNTKQPDTKSTKMMPKETKQNP